MIKIDNDHNLFNPTEDHKELRESVGKFARLELDEQAKEHDEKEMFNDTLLEGWERNSEFLE